MRWSSFAPQRRHGLLWLLLVGLVASAAENPVELGPNGRPVNLVENIDRPLRYTPVGTDFVITNGAEYFNRPLYGNNSAFRVDAGDRPEFSLYLPGRGGNLRLGLKTPLGIKWLNDADQIIARYRPGAMEYTVRDPVLMSLRTLHLTALPLSGRQGFIVRAEANSAWMDVELIWAYGGANGMKGRRGGDIGCEREPVAQFFQLQTGQCAGSEFAVASNTFTLRTKTATIAGAASAGTVLSLGNAAEWAHPDQLLADIGSTSDRSINDFPVLVGRVRLSHESPVFLVLQPVTPGLAPLQPDQLADAFDAAAARRQGVAGRVTVKTPDPFINAAAAALNVAADGIWDEAQQSFMHGAVAWRMRLLGWRGAHAGDALGWHERTAAHLTGFARQQNTNPIPATLPPADAGANLSRNEAALHSNGDLTRSHYDMNLVAVDALFRHLLWTGDRAFAESMWPVIERHLAWERRLFRREFGPDKLPLYEGYACIWASDDLAYNGGGAAHASAYNYYHNRMAARVARWLGKDPSPYDHEAELIARAMQKYLWLPREGSFAEWKDWLGRQQVHPAAALWTFYHTLDSEASTPQEAWRMSRFVDTHFPRIPVRGPGVPEGNFTLPTTTWMPYTWSLNNVVMAESMHTSLAYWQAGRSDAAFPLFKGALLDSMYLGLCPGNVGMCTAYDAYRGESQRDFADGVGATSRALIEGLFGIKPDALAGVLRIEPGFPAAWDHATLEHPDVSFQFRRDGSSETYIVDAHFPRPMALRLNVAALGEAVAAVTVNGVPAKWETATGDPGWPRVAIAAPAAPHQEVKIAWQGGPVTMSKPLAAVEPPVTASSQSAPVNWHTPILPAATFACVDLSPLFNDSVTQIFRHEYLAPRSPFCSLAAPKQGIGSWCHPNDSFDVDDSGLRAVAAAQGNRILLPNGIPLATPGAADSRNIAFVSQWNNFPDEVTLPLRGRSSHAYLLMAGSTSAMQSRFDNGEVIFTYTDGRTARLALRNPETWWPIDQDYFIDDFAFRWSGPLPPRVDLRTGKVRVLDLAAFKGKGGRVPGGAATVLDLPLDAGKTLKSLTVRALANEVVIGLMSVTLAR
ncbi:MAG TPA: DUF4450 domain-containing protein [Verrucomicrobiae bacterium]|nr:DUF4450 domain-containing protein [Verrucomicrobiae bacterium]